MVVVPLRSVIEDQLQSNDFTLKAVAFEKIPKLLKDIGTSIVGKFTAGYLDMILTTAFQLSCATFLITLRAFVSSISFTLGLKEKIQMHHNF